MVLPIKSPAEIRFVDKLGPNPNTLTITGPYPYRAREDKDGHLRIFGGTHEGWVDKSEFVLVRDGIEYFSRRIAASSTDSFAYGMRGSAWMDKKQWDNAIADLDVALRLKPNATSFNNRGTAWAAKKEL